MNKADKKILIIEDDQNLVNLLIKKLLNDGYKDIVFAVNGLDGLNLAKSAKPDLIILDLMLPGMDGYHVCAYLKNDTKYNKIKIVMYTVKPTYNDLKLGKEVGADSYLIKGTDDNDLLNTIEQLLKGKELEESVE